MSKIKSKNDSLIIEFINDPNYEVLQDGTILSRYSRQGHLTDKSRVMALTSNRGYKKLRYKGKYIQLHRIVYAKWVGQLDENLTINHIDGNPSNNAASNLEQVTQSENNIHRFRVLKKPAVVGNSKLNLETANLIRTDYLTGLGYGRLAKKYDVSKTTIAYVIQNRIWKPA